MWFYGDNRYHNLQAVKTTQYGKVTYLMDAYTSAWYNSLTNNMFASPTYQDVLIEKLGMSEDYVLYGKTSSVAKPVGDGIPVQSESPVTIYGVPVYTDWGILNKEYGRTAGGSYADRQYYDIAKLAYINPDKWGSQGHLLGIRTNPGGDWYSSDNGYAIYGGITIALSEIGEGIPVYYHITNDPEPVDPTDPPIGSQPTYTEEWIPDPTNPTFIPDPEYIPDGGTVIQIIPDPNPDTPEYPDPSTIPETITIPDPPIIVVPPDDPPPPEIHVWVNDPPEDIPVYLHTYTYSVDEDSPLLEDPTAEQIHDWLKENPSAYADIVCTKIDSLPLNTTAQKYTIPDKKVVDAESSVITFYYTPTKAYPAIQYPAYIERLSFNSTDFLDGSQLNIKDYYYGTNRLASSIHLKNIKFVPLGPAVDKETDRIKSWDVTQYIDQTTAGVSGSAHLGNLKSSEDNNINGYNTTEMDAVNNSGVQKTHAVVIQSNPISDFPVNKTVQTNTHTNKTIYTSRTQFNVPLAVEGTTAGEYGKSGLIYAATDSKGKSIDELELVLSDGKLTLNFTEDDYESAWRENTFEIAYSAYANVGLSTEREDSLLAEYRYTIPTKNYVFNPSYYMLYDDGFDEDNQNKSVWMLSEQPREINFKDVLSIKLNQDLGADDASEGAQNGYATSISSEWSSDKEDITGATLPTAKAANAYVTNTSTQTGSITAYVVLQDPEFTGNPSETQAANDEKLAAYNAQMQKILDESYS